MTKTETIHARVSKEIKEKADAIFSELGLTTSHAISLFLTATVNKKGFPFELCLPTIEDDFEFAKTIATIDGGEVSEDAKRIFILYKKGDIDLETAKFVIKRLHSKK